MTIGATLESKDIEVKISIIRKSIDFYKRNIDSPDFFGESLERIKRHLEREEQNLEILKDKYPEYFV